MKKAVTVSILFALLVSILACGTSNPVVESETYDLVISGGRVIDPESNLDAVRNIGIRGNRIEAVTTDALKGANVIDAGGLVVAPGFIDMHSHGQDDENYRYKAMDGVTTALELEVGAWPVSDWYAQREGKAFVNYGVTVGHIPARMKVTGDTGAFLPRDKAITTRLTPEQKREMEELIKQGLDEGAIGIGYGIAYVPAATRGEILDLFRLSLDRKVTNYVHLRSHGALEPGSAIESVQEVLANAAATGASLHIVHITSTGLSQTPECLSLIRGARERGVDVTTEAYPYTAAMTGLETAIFNEGWQEKMGITFKDLQWVATGERLTPATFTGYRKQGGMVVIHSIPEAAARAAIEDKSVIVASDGMLSAGKGHPRGAGSYARVLGHYVRDQKAISLMDAINKMSLLPARRLEATVPIMKNKGRINVGADADLSIFDPGKVIDRATFENPAQYSDGFKYVIVNGVQVVSNGKLVDGVFPGTGIRRN
ncbi:MAG: amidohydrolase family protein [Acidobacteriota bacterium]|nr:MAG: amidohydrolase family protein [Acidobacteriota bacterium]